MTANADASKSIWVDSDDAPELTDTWFEGATLNENGVPKRRPGGRGPGRRPRKQAVTLRLDPDIVEHFQRGGAGWQTRINATLREAIETTG